MSIARRALAPASWALLLLAGLLSCWSAGSRGAYADDFLFLHYLSTRSILEGITEWHFNSRWTQAVLITWLYQPAVAAHGLNGWWPVHVLALACLAVIGLAIERCLALTGHGPRTRALVLGLFLIHPGKAQATLWLATIVGYLIPAAWVALACWYHLQLAAQGRETLLRLTPVLLAYATACLSLEQFLPYCGLLVLLRLIGLPADLGAWLRNAGLVLALAAIFLAATLTGSTGQRLAHHGGMGQVGVLANLLEVLVASLETSLIGIARIWLDTDLRGMLLAALLDWTTWTAVLAFTAAFAWLQPTPLCARPGYRLAILGVLIWLAPLSPLLLIDYYAPERVFFLSLVGLAMLAACGIEWLLHALPAKGVHYLLIGLIGLPLVVASRVRDAQFVQQWAYTRELLDAVATTQPTAAESVLVVAGFPRAIDPVPDVLYGRMLDGLVAVALDEPTASGRADPDLEFSLPGLCSAPDAHAAVLGVLPGQHLWLWAAQGWRPVQGLAFTPQDALQAGHEPAVWQPSSFRQRYSEALELHVPGVVRLPEADVLIVCVDIDLPTGLAGSYRLNAHGIDRDGGRQVYDRDLTEKDDIFHRRGTRLRRAFLVRKASQLAELHLGLSGTGIRALAPASDALQDLELRGR